MDSLPPTQSAQVRQTRQQFVNPEDYLSYELGKAVRELPPLYTRVLAGTLTAIVMGTIGWAYLSKIDEVAVAQGEIIPTSQIRPVRALEGGVISEIKVKEGDRVKQGDVLIKQDPALSKTEVDRIQQNVALVRQDVARLDAESKGNSSSGSAIQDQLIASRLREFDTRQAAANADTQRQVAVIGEARARLARLQENLNSARATMINAQERESSLRQLVEQEGAVPRFDYLQAKDQLTEAQNQIFSLEQDIVAQQQSIQQAQQSYTGAQQSANRLSSERQSEILTQMNQRRQDLTELEGQLNQAQVRAKGQVIVAPISGKIYNIQTSLAERTIAPGQDLLSILPDSHDLLVEAKVLNRDIGFIKEGMRVKVKVATFPFQEFGTIDGEVVRLTPNATLDKDLGLVYTVRVMLKRKTINVEGKDVELTPGMAVTAEVVTRKRSILTFMLEPITRRFSEALTER
ncbi:MAG: HlyD family type I secretion periplasmic adaptor subunit [Timaviella obliquedivisa GSE-PSE-MK23-08B]|jgi:HlyD family secretion protein|nr:HlyD family type I secretion periplasmic adaptor subunit [Timaviella obliquedivisa GSE-PSE-MK23-08B]